MESSVRSLPALFRKDVKKELEQSIPLSLHTHFRIGGPADFFFQAETVLDLMRSVLFARRCGLPYYILGGGYNLLCDDSGYRGFIIKNTAGMISQTGEGELSVESGARIQDLMRFCVDHAVGGLEFLAGIPGTVGGAVFGNAGAFDSDIGSRVSGVSVLSPEGNRQWLPRSELGFGYRHSRFKCEPMVVLDVLLLGNRSERKRIEEQMRGNLQKRADRHPPMNVACAGSYFKNPLQPDGTKVPAACLLEEVGAKLLREGEAAIYHRHSNFIINLGAARAEDVRNLASKLKKRVRERFGVELEEEVIFLPADSPGLLSVPD